MIPSRYHHAGVMEDLQHEHARAHTDSHEIIFRRLELTALLRNRIWSQPFFNIKDNQCFLANASIERIAFKGHEGQRRWSARRYIFFVRHSVWSNRPRIYPSATPYYSKHLVANLAGRRNSGRIMRYSAHTNPHKGHCLPVSRVYSL